MHNSEEKFWRKQFEDQGARGRETGNLEEALCGRVVRVDPRIEECRRRYSTQAMSIREGNIVLDAGCGFGDFIVSHLHTGCGFVGLDFSLPMLRTARERILQAHGKSLPFVGGSISRIPLKDACVDVVYCHGVLHHIADDKVEDVFREFRRVLRKDGRLLVEFKNSWSPYGVTHIGGNFLRSLVRHRPASPAHYRSWPWYRRRLGRYFDIQSHFSTGLHPVRSPAFLVRGLAYLELLSIPTILKLGVGFWYAGVPKKKLNVGDTESSLDKEGQRRREPASLPAGAARS